MTYDFFLEFHHHHHKCLIWLDRYFIIMITMVTYLHITCIVYTFIVLNWNWIYLDNIEIQQQQKKIRFFFFYRKIIIILVIIIQSDDQWLIDWLIISSDSDSVWFSFSIIKFRFPEILSISIILHYDCWFNQFLMH